MVPVELLNVSGFVRDIRCLLAYGVGIGARMYYVVGMCREFIVVLFYILLRFIDLLISVLVHETDSNDQFEFSLIDIYTYIKLCL